MNYATSSSMMIFNASPLLLELMLLRVILYNGKVCSQWHHNTGKFNSIFSQQNQHQPPKYRYLFEQATLNTLNYTLERWKMWLHIFRKLNQLPLVLISDFNVSYKTAQHLTSITETSRQNVIVLLNWKPVFCNEWQSLLIRTLENICVV